MDELAPYFLKCLLRGLPETLYFKDRESRYTLVSEYKAFLHGFSGAEELVGKTDADLFTEEHARLAHEEERKIMATGVSVIGKLQKLAWPDGHESWTLSSKMPLRGPAGAIIGTFGMSRDVTRTRKMEEALERTHAELVEASRIAGAAEVASGVLHNVSNVITAVSCSSQVIVEGLREMNTARLVTLCDQLPGADELKMVARYLDRERSSLLSVGGTLENSIEHAARVIKLQQEDAMSAGAIERILATDLVDDALRISENEFRIQNVQVVRDYRSTEKVLVNKHRALQVLINLIQNAIQAVAATSNSEKRVTLLVESNESDRVSISVSDNGIGIPRENLSRIFSHGFTTRRGGHGFGLHSSIVAAQGMGALLSAYSDGPGTGATFIFMLLAATQEGSATVKPSLAQEVTP